MQRTKGAFYKVANEETSERVINDLLDIGAKILRIDIIPRTLNSTKVGILYVPDYYHYEKVSYKEDSDKWESPAVM